MNATYDEFSNNGTLCHEEDQLPLFLARSIDHHPLSAYSTIEGSLLDYFIREIGPKCSLSDSYNPYISLVTPLCFDHSALRSALIAVAANQLCLIGDMRFKKEACLFKERALQGLQRAILTNSLDYNTVTTVLMLCFYDVWMTLFLAGCAVLTCDQISDGCDSSWVTHLRGGLKLISQLSSQTRQYDSFISFLTMYFVAHDIMNRTASELGHENMMESCSWLESDDCDEVFPEYRTHAQECKKN